MCSLFFCAQTFLGTHIFSLLCFFFLSPPLWWRCLGSGCKGARLGWLQAGQGWGRAALHSGCYHYGLSPSLHPVGSGDGTGGSQKDSFHFPRSGSPHHSQCHRLTAGFSAEPTSSWWKELTWAHAALHHQLPVQLPLEGKAEKGGRVWGSRWEREQNEDKHIFKHFGLFQNQSLFNMIWFCSC